jgi:hypothetical protein
MILPLLPLIAGFLLLDLVDATGGDFLDFLASGTVNSGTGRLFQRNLELRFLNALLPYLAMALFHSAACLALLVLLIKKIGNLAQHERVWALIVFGSTLAMLVSIAVLVQLDGHNGPLNLGYRNICHTLKASGLENSLLPIHCDAEGLSWFAWFALLPLVLGVLIAALANSVASIPLSPPRTAETGLSRAQLCERKVLLEHAFKAVAFILATSTLALVIFYRLPLAVIKDPSAAALLGSYGHAMTMYWGILFTLTLACIFGPPAMRLSVLFQQVDAQKMRPGRSQGSEADSPRQLTFNILTTLAPVIIGASGIILEVVAGSVLESF